MTLHFISNHKIRISWVLVTYTFSTCLKFFFPDAVAEYLHIHPLQYIFVILFCLFFHDGSVTVSLMKNIVDFQDPSEIKWKKSTLLCELPLISVSFHIFPTSRLRFFIVLSVYINVTSHMEDIVSMEYPNK